MKEISTKKLTMAGAMMGLVVLTTLVTRFPGPVPPGYINFGDIVIMVTAVLLGRNYGALAGGLGSALADIIAGFPVFAPATLVIKALEGYVAGSIAHGAEKKENKKFLLWTGMGLGAVVMVAGYFLAELTLLRWMDDTFGWIYAVSELPLNLVQGGVSTVAAFVLSHFLLKKEVTDLITK